MALKDKKLILRVITKLLATFALLVMAYVFMLGLLSNENGVSDEKMLLLDVSELKLNEVKFFEHGRRKILVLRGSSGEYLVAYANDPVFGCPIDWRNGKFVSICNGAEFDSDGKVYPGQATDEDLELLDFEFDANGRLEIFLE